MKMQILSFAHIFVKNGSIYVKSRLNWLTAYSTHIIKYISLVEILHFVIICTL